jgi:hypothetical protein
MRTAGLSRGEGSVHIGTTGAATPTNLDDDFCTALSCVGSCISDPDMLQAKEKTWCKVG